MRRSLLTKKRGSLQLSINAIVILILAITLLGLGLAFIKGIFGGTVGRLTDIEKSLGQQERNELLSSAKEITLKLTEVDVKGREAVFNMALRNNRPEAHRFDISGEVDIGDTTSGFVCFDAIGKAAKERLIERNERGNPLISFETFETVELEGAKARVLPVIITVEPDAVPTTYSWRVRAFITGKEVTVGQGIDDVEPEPYATQNFILNYEK